MMHESRCLSKNIGVVTSKLVDGDTTGAFGIEPLLKNDFSYLLFGELVGSLFCKSTTAYNYYFSLMSCRPCGPFKPQILLYVFGNNSLNQFAVTGTKLDGHVVGDCSSNSRKV